MEPLRVGRMPRWQLAVQELRDKQDELWRYYASIYANSSSGAEGTRGGGEGVPSAGIVGLSNHRAIRIYQHTTGARLVGCPGLTCPLLTPHPHPPLPAAMADIRSYFHRDFDLMQVPDRPGSVAVVGGIAAAGSAAAAAAAEGTAG